jgi:cellulose synthase/poly-beta-1,6-N-acetylglucosamine synthase-like glycosyltransferase
MPFLPGYAAMPTTLLNAVLGSTREGEAVVRGPDRLAVVSPMFEEEAGAGPALRSLLVQSRVPDEVAVSVNGGRDRTAEVVAATLREAGYRRADHEPMRGCDAVVDRWAPPSGLPPVVVATHARPTSKSDGINAVLAAGLLSAERILVVDGDTRFHPDFVRALRDGFYRLRRERRGGRTRFVVEDVAIQSGAVDSLPPGPGRPIAGLVSRARAADYALAALLRSGQTRRPGGDRVFGATRLFTAVGCGFAARREAFPMPSDTWTEDHDFSLRVQNAPDEEASLDPRSLHDRGLRVVVDGAERSPLEVFDRHDEVVLRRSSGARFVEGARMSTEDPTSLTGYLRQVERWHGGGVENALKRVATPGTWGRQRPNVRFAVLAGQLENVLGLLLLLALPFALGLHTGAPGVGGIGPAGLAAWLGFDLVATGLLVFLGARRLSAARASSRGGRWRPAIRTVTRGVAPLLLLRPLNVVALVAATLHVVPAFVRANRGAGRPSRVWTRPRAAAAGGPWRFVVLGVALVAVAGSSFEATRQWAQLTWPDDRTVQRLLIDAPTIDLDDHRHLPPRRPGPDGPSPPEGGPSAEPVPAPRLPSAARGVLDRLGGLFLLPVGARAQDPPRPTPELSRFCPPSVLPAPAGEPRRLNSSVDDGPLGPWGLLLLARLAPLLPHLEEAATAYDVPADLLLQVLLNESYLDPLAVGPTDDLGISQMTTDSLTMLGALAHDPASRFANPSLFPPGFSAFDPDFSICAGAAMLAWSRSQPGGGDAAIAYARYVNPRHGVRRDRVSDRHRPLVEAFEALAPTVRSLAAAVARFREDPAAASAAERELLEVAREVAEGRIAVADAYARVATRAAELGIDDLAFYREVLARLYGRDDALGPPGTDDPGS